MASLLKYFARRMRSEEGNVIILVGLMAFLLIMSMGVAVDMTRAQILQQRMSASLDAAGLAAAEDIDTPPTGMCTSPLTVACATTWANTDAARYFNANFPAGYLGSAVGAPSVTLSNGLNTLSLTVSGSQQPVFMQTFGFSTITVAAQSTVTRSSNGLGLEVALVLDNTGSMNCNVALTDCSGDAGTKIDGLRTAGNELVNILFGTSVTPPNDLWVGIIPFTQAVNVGTGSTTALNSGAFDSAYNAALPFDSNNAQGQWGGCVNARSTGLIDATTGLSYDEGDTPPSTTTAGSLFQDYFYAPSAYYAGAGQPPTAPTYTPPASAYDVPLATPPTPNQSCSVNPDETCFYNQWQVGPATGGESSYSYAPDVYTNGLLFPNMGPNAKCPQQVLQMTANETNILNSITAMTAQGDTEINIGLAWGFRMLSPRWQGIWTSAEMSGNGLPLAYNTPNFTKVLVLMTDGTNYLTEGDYSAYGFFNSGTLGASHVTPPDIAGCDDAAGDCVQAAALDLDDRTAAICTYLKAQGVVVYTIGFGNPAPDNPPTLNDRQNFSLVDQPLLQNCAGGTSNGITGQYFLAPTNAALKTAFQQIGNALENIRISK